MASPSPATAAEQQQQQLKDLPMDLNKHAYDKHSAVNLLSKFGSGRPESMALGASSAVDFESHHHHQLLLQQSIYNNLGVTPLLLNNNVSKSGLFKEVCGGDFDERMTSDQDSAQSDEDESPIVGGGDFEEDLGQEEDDEEIQMRKKCRLDEDLRDDNDDDDDVKSGKAQDTGEEVNGDEAGQVDQKTQGAESVNDVITTNTNNSSSATSGRSASRPNSASAASLKSGAGGGNSSRPSSASPRGGSPMLNSSNNGGGYHKQATILDIFKGRKMLNGLNNSSSSNINNTQQQELQNRENLFHPAFSSSNNASTRSSPLTAAALSAAANLNGTRQVVIKSEFESSGRLEHGRSSGSGGLSDHFGRSGSNHHHHHHRSASLRDGIRRSSRSPLHDAKGENLMTPPGGVGVPPSSSTSSLGNALLANLASLGAAAAFPGFTGGPSGNSSSGDGTSSCSSSDIQRSLSSLLSQQNASAMSALAALHAGSQAAASPLNLSSGQASSLGPAQLAQLISQQQQAAAAATFLNANGGASNASMPQLLLASGQIVQGVQGAQLLIPTSQGLVAQSILAIPLAQGSPPLFHPPASPPAGGHAPRGHHHENRGSPPNRDLLGAHMMSEHQKLMNEGRNGFRSSKSGSTGSSSNNNNSSSSALNNHSVNNSHLNNISNSHHHQQQQHSDQHRNSISSSLSSSQRTVSDYSGYPRFPAKIMSPSATSLRDDEMTEDDDESEDKFSDNDDPDQMVDGINLDEIKEFAKAFKLRRLSLGLTQTQVGQALSVTEGPAYSQSAICSALAWQLAQSNRTSATTTTSTTSTTTDLPQPSMFEKLDITPKSAQKIKPVLERWMKEAEERYKHGHQNLNDFVGMEPSKKRKRRTSFTPQALEILNTHFERNTHPSGNEITTLAHQLGYEREVIRIWFCNKRQALKNTVRMMSKGGSPI